MSTSNGSRGERERRQTERAKRWMTPLRQVGEPGPAVDAGGRHRVLDAFEQSKPGRTPDGAPSPEARGRAGRRAT